MIHPSAIIGDPPEHRDWHPGMPLYRPEIAPDAQINAFVSIDAGFHAATRVGARTLVMKHVHIGHDAVVGKDCELAPSVVVGGHCVIGDRVKIGVNACLRPFVQVGDDARIGAGAVVVRDVPVGEVWAGNPARPLRRRAAPEMTELEREGWDEWWMAREAQKEAASASWA